MSDLPDIPRTCIRSIHVSGIFYFGNLAGNLFVHIPQVLQKLLIFPRSFTQTPGLFFSGVLHIHGTCTAFLHVFDSWKFICAHPADALEILHFSWVIYTDTRVVFFRVFHPFLRHVLHLYMCVIAGNLFVHILHMLQQFRIFPRSFTRTPGFLFRVSAHP